MASAVEAYARKTWTSAMPLSTTSVYPYFLVSALLLAVGSGISQTSRFYEQLLDAESTSTRFHAVDGLRGFLALGVFFHHAVISYFYYVHGRWEIPPSRFYTMLGQVGVALFFMITAFLFWTKGLQSLPYLRAQPMLWSRLCRLLPMYLFSIACVSAVVAVLTNFEMRYPAKTLLWQVCAWLSFGFVAPGELNGFRQSWIINGSVQWSLVYEWLFYLFLPLGLIFSRGLGFFLLFVVASVFIQAFSSKAIEWNFLFGALAALLVARGGLLPGRAWKAGLVTLFATSALILVFVTFQHGYGLLQTGLLFSFFVCIANGNSLFGVLTSRAARFLGTISYSIYLMHAIVLFVMLRLINRVVPISTMTPEQYWLVVAACGVAVVSVCAITYRFIEQPWMKRSMPKWLGNHSPTEVAPSEQRQSKSK